MSRRKLFVARRNCAFCGDEVHDMGPPGKRWFACWSCRTAKDGVGTLYYDFKEGGWLKVPEGTLAVVASQSRRG